MFILMRQLVGEGGRDLRAQAIRDASLDLDEPQRRLEILIRHRQEMLEP